MNKPLSGAGGGGGNPTIVKDSVRSQDTIEFVMGVCEGPVAGLVEGPKSFFLGDTPLVSQSGEPNFEVFELHTYAGASTPTRVRTALGGTASNEQVGVTLAWGVPVTRTTPVSLRGKIDRIEVRLIFNQLLRTNNDGDQLEAKAEYLIQYRKTTGPDTSWKSFVGSDTGGVKASMMSSMPIAWCWSSERPATTRRGRPSGPTSQTPAGRIGFQMRPSSPNSTLLPSSSRIALS